MVLEIRGFIYLILNNIYLNLYRNKKLRIVAMSPYLRRRVFNLCETQYFKYSFAELRILCIFFYL